MPLVRQCRSVAGPEQRGSHLSPPTARQECTSKSAGVHHRSASACARVCVCVRACASVHVCVDFEKTELDPKKQWAPRVYAFCIQGNTECGAKLPECTCRCVRAEEMVGPSRCACLFSFLWRASQMFCLFARTECGQIMPEMTTTTTKKRH